MIFRIWITRFEFGGSQISSPEIAKGTTIIADLNFFAFLPEVPWKPTKWKEKKHYAHRVAILHASAEQILIRVKQTLQVYHYLLNN